MADNNIAASAYFVQPVTSTDTEQKTVGVGVPLAQGPVSSTGTTLSLTSTHAERLVRLQHATSNVATIDANTKLGNGNSVRLLRDTAGIAKASWGTGVKINGTSGTAGEAVIASQNKSIVVTQLAEGEFVIDGNIAS